MLETEKTILIVGGGIAATRLATTLEASIRKLPGYRIVLITGRRYFFHILAGLRANVQESDLAENICLPYDRLFKDPSVAQVITEHVKEVKSDCVVLDDGSVVPFTYAVIATGKQWMHPLDLPDERDAALERIKAYQSRVKAAKHILVIGGGAVGVEMAGEIAGAYPSAEGKKVTLIHWQDALMNDTYNTNFRAGLQKQLVDLGVYVLLNDALEGDYDLEQTGCQTLTTKGGKRIEKVELVIRTTGGQVNTDLLQSLVPQLLSSNGVEVKSTFQLEGHDNIFAVGDVVDVSEQKQAAKVPGHVSLVHSNLLASIHGTALQKYKAPLELIVVNIGEKGAMAFLPLPWVGAITLGGWFARVAKGADLAVPLARSALGY